MINQAFHAVRAFHLAMEQPAPDRPAMQSSDQVERRMDWIDEEQTELREASTIEDQADAYIDIIYFALGGLVEIGIVPGEIFALAHKANMAKLWPDGKTRLREDGKIIKPDDWVDPTPAQRAAVRRQVESPPMRTQAGPCAKVTVTCTLICADGSRVIGTNACADPQETCPRAPGEDYTKCETICRQMGHAEVEAVRLAGPRAKGSHAYVEGITYACRSCQEALFGAGVAALTIGAPPHD